MIQTRTLNDYVTMALVLFGAGAGSLVTLVFPSVFVAIGFFMLWMLLGWVGGKQPRGRGTS